MNRFPTLTPRDWRGLIALIASIAGAAVLTVFSVWVVRLLVAFARGDPAIRLGVIRALANSNYGLLIIIGSILLSLGLAINRRSLRASAFGASIEADGGDGNPGAEDAAGTST
jgi:hypothetical protein